MTYAGVAQLSALLVARSLHHIAANRLVSALVHRNWALAGPPMRHENRVDGLFQPGWTPRSVQLGQDRANLMQPRTVAGHGHEDWSWLQGDCAGDRFVTASADGKAAI
jgi:hypothetical protein